jgi:hypothetical protein
MVEPPTISRAPLPAAPGRSRRSWLVLAAAWGVGSLVTLAVVAYMWWWIPYQHPEEEVPRIAAIIPDTPLAGAAGPSADEYAWVDAEEGIVRIPVAVAIEVLHSQLPVQADAAEVWQRWRDAEVPTGAGSGRRVIRTVPSADRPPPGD